MKLTPTNVYIETQPAEPICKGDLAGVVILKDGKQIEIYEGIELNICVRGQHLEKWASFNFYDYKPAA